MFSMLTPDCPGLTLAVLRVPVLTASCMANCANWLIVATGGHS